MAENEVIEDISTDLKYFIKSIVPNSKYKNTELDTNEETNSDGYLSNISKDLKYFIKCIVPNSVYKDGSNPVPGSGGDSGEEVIANDSSYLYSLVVDGKAVQDGTPTPSAPVDVQVVQGINLLKPRGKTTTISGVTFTQNNDGSLTLSGTATAIAAYPISNNNINLIYVPAGTYTISANGLASGVKIAISGTSGYNGFPYKEVTSTNTSQTGAVTDGSKSFGYITVIVASGTALTTPITIYPQLEAGSTATPYIKSGCLGLDIDGTITPIDLQGNVLASLPDGTKDVLTVDSVGHCVIEKVLGVKKASEFTLEYHSSGFINFIGDLPLLNTSIAIWSDMFVGTTAYNSVMADNEVKQTSNSINSPTIGQIRIKNSTEFTSLNAAQTWFASHDATFIYLLATPQTIDLGYIDVPAIPDGSEISIVAQVTPNIDVEWWTINQDATARAISTVMDEIKATETNVLNNIAKVENGKASANYSVGSYLISNGKLYKVTSAIASGENIVSGTNVTATTVMAELVALTS